MKYHNIGTINVHLFGSKFVVAATTFIILSDINNCV
jgi:hypothetical protein